MRNNLRKLYEDYSSNKSPKASLIKSVTLSADVAIYVHELFKIGVEKLVDLCSYPGSSRATNVDLNNSRLHPATYIFQRRTVF